MASKDEIELTITERIKKIVANGKVAIRHVEGGILIEVVGANPSEDLENQIATTCLEYHQTLPAGENAFPFHIFIYSDSSEAFKSQVLLKTRAHEFRDGGHVSYWMAEDAVINAREIDAEALLYGVKYPFTLEGVGSKATQPPSTNTRYEEIDIFGSHYLLQDGKARLEEDGHWKIVVEGRVG